MGKKRYVTQLYCHNYCIVDLESNDPDYIVWHKNGTFTCFPKIVYALPIRDGNKRRVKRECMRLNNDDRKGKE